MSGGSFDYMFIKECHRLVEAQGDLIRMKEELERLGFKDAATKTAVILHMIHLIEQIQAEMADVWQAVEWYCSSDWDEEQVEVAVDKWRDSILALTPESPEEPPG